MDDLDSFADGFSSYMETKQYFSKRNKEGKSKVSSHRKNYRKEENNVSKINWNFIALKKNSCAGCVFFET